MVEIETKVMECSHRDFEDRILALGGKKVFDGITTSIFLTNGNGEFQDRIKVLRVRKEGDRTTLAFKSKIIECDSDKCKTTTNSAKIREEVEIYVDDFEKTMELLSRLGFKPKSKGVKRRVSYVVKEDNINLDFDDYMEEDSHIPEFLEIEGESEKVIEEFAKKLDITADKLKPWGFSKLKKYYM